jgi:hypothetical protein
MTISVDGRGLMLAHAEESAHFFIGDTDTNEEDQLRTLPANATLYLDPGPHHFVLSAGDYTQAHELELKEGDRRTLIWKARTSTAPEIQEAAPTTPPASPREPTKRTLTIPAERPSDASFWHHAGIGALAFGGAGLAIAAVAGIVAGNASGELDDACSPDGDCPPAKAGTVSRHEAATRLTTVGLVMGATGSLVGVGLLLLDGSRQGGPSVAVRMGASRLELRGRF